MDDKHTIIPAPPPPAPLLPTQQRFPAIQRVPSEHLLLLFHAQLLTPFAAIVIVIVETRGIQWDRELYSGLLFPGLFSRPDSLGRCWRGCSANTVLRGVAGLNHVLADRALNSCW